MRKLWNSMDLISDLARHRSSFAPLLFRSYSGTGTPFNRRCTEAQGLLLNRPNNKFIASPFQIMETLIHNSSQIVPSTQLQRIEKKSQLEEAFVSAETTEQMLKAFSDMEEQQGVSFDERELGLASLKIGLRLDREGKDHEKTLPFAFRALKALDKEDDNPSLPVVMVLLLLGTLNYRLKRYSDSLEYLNRAITVFHRLPDEVVSYNDVNQVLLAGLTMSRYAMNSQLKWLECHVNYSKRLVLDGIIFNRDRALKYVAVLNSKEALPCCLKALENSKLNVVQPVQVALDRRLLGILCSGLEECEKPQEQNILAHRILKNWNLSSDLLQAEIDAANRMICLERYDEAVGILKNVVQQTDKDSGKRALLLISMAKVLYEQEHYVYCKRCLQISVEILNKRERISLLEVAEAITEISELYDDVDDFAYCKRCLRISLRRLCKSEWISSPVEVAEAYSEISMQYETMNEFLTAIWLLERLLDLLEGHLQLQHLMGSVSASIGRLLLLIGEVQPAILYLGSAAERLKDNLGPEHSGVGYVYNNLGVAFLELGRPQLAVQMFAAAKGIMDVSLSPHHPDAIEAFQNLAKACGEIGSYDIAVEFQQKVIDAWENHGASAEDELREGSRHLGQLKKKACGAYANELSMKALPLPKKPVQLWASATSRSFEVDMPLPLLKQHSYICEHLPRLHRYMQSCINWTRHLLGRVNGLIGH